MGSISRFLTAYRMSRPTKTGIRTLALVATLAVSCAAAAHAATPRSLDSYRGAGTWIDIYDPRILADPYGAVDEASAAGVRAIFIETANYRRPAYGTIAYPFATASLLDAAHSKGLKVVAWYLPSFADLRRDLKRSLAAIRFTTLLGGRFDSFALDIESSVVKSSATRNARTLRLSRRIRRAVGPSYPLGAIVPDQRSTTIGLPSLWPHFPYSRLRPLYDVFLPMSYSSARGRGSKYAYDYTLANISWLRAATGDAGLPVHVVGGLANKLRQPEAQAVIEAARAGAAIGASFYDLALSGDEEWQALASLGGGPEDTLMTRHSSSP
jgi:hypothetical protein